MKAIDKSLQNLMLLEAKNLFLVVVLDQETQKSRFFLCNEIQVETATRKKMKNDALQGHSQIDNMKKNMSPYNQTYEHS